MDLNIVGGGAPFELTLGLHKIKLMVRKQTSIWLKNKTKESHKLFNHLTPRVKLYMIQSFHTFDSMDRTLKCDHSLESCLAVLYCGVVC